MKDFIELGSAPCDEECAQVGEENYRERAYVECYAYIEQLKRIIETWVEELPQSFGFKIKSFAHDFGHYYEVSVYFADEDDKAMHLAYKLEDNLPAKWDEISTESLAKYGKMISF